MNDLYEIKTWAGIAWRNRTTGLVSVDLSSWVIPRPAVLCNTIQTIELALIP